MRLFAVLNQPRLALISLCGFSFLTSATYSVARALGVSLFIARMGSDALPVALVASAVTVIAVSAITHLINQRFPARFSVIGSWIGLASITTWLTAMISVEHHSFVFLGALYVIAEVRGCVNTIYSTTLVNNAFASSTSKRPYVLVATGAPIAGIITGVAMGYGASVLQDTTWLKLIIALDAATILLLRWIPQAPAMTERPAPEPLSRIERSKRLLQKSARQLKRLPASPSIYRYRYGLVSLIAFNVFAVTMVDYQWKVIAGDHLLVEHKLLTYFAGFYAINDVLIVLVQLTVATKLLDRYGIGMPLCAYPLLLSILGLIALINRSPAVLILLFTLGQGLTVLKRSLYDPGLTSAYGILPPGIRNETILLIKGVIKPLIEAVVAVGLLLLASHLNPNQITSSWLAALIPWFLLSSWVSSTYEKWTSEPPAAETSGQFKLSER